MSRSCEINNLKLSVIIIKFLFSPTMNLDSNVTMENNNKLIHLNNKQIEQFNM